MKRLQWSEPVDEQRWDFFQLRRWFAEFNGHQFRITESKGPALRRVYYAERRVGVTWIGIDPGAHGPIKRHRKLSKARRAVNEYCVGLGAIIEAQPARKPKRVRKSKRVQKTIVPTSQAPAPVGSACPF